MNQNPAAPPRTTEQRCPSCAATVPTDLPFCGSCGTRITVPVAAALTCNNCGRADVGGNKFCPSCGHPAHLPTPRPMAAVVMPGGRAITLVLLDRSAQEISRFALQGAVTTLGRNGADLNFPDDGYLSPVHAQFLMVEGSLVVRDLGSRNGTWVYLDRPHRLVEGDMVLVGSQVLRYRRLGYPGPRPPEADNTRRLGSLTPQTDMANLAQIRSDGRARDMVHLSPGRTVRIGREQGDWQFPYDPSMSALHASIRSEDADFVVADEGSRNGIAIAVRSEYILGDKTRLLLGDQMIRTEFA
ncbi:MAG: FHA domain-containing protein [Gemmatimonadota bacterium]